MVLRTTGIKVLKKILRIFEISGFQENLGFRPSGGLVGAVFGVWRCAAAQFHSARICMWLVELELSGIALLGE